MKVPEPLFKFINPLMALLLRSPLHFVASGSLLLITFVGRRTGRSRTTPLRYVRDGETVRCFSSRNTLWWRNLVGGAEVKLRIRGAEGRYRADVILDDPQRIEELLKAYLAEYPQDAAYHEVKLNKDGTPNAADLARAVAAAVVMEAQAV